MLVASPEYITAHGAPTVSSELNERNVFMYRTPRGVLDWLVQKDGNWKAVELKPKYITNHGRSLLDSVRAGDGIAFLPGWGVASDIESGRMVKIELEDGPLSTRVGAETGLYLLYHPPKFRLQKIRVTVDFLVNELGRDSN